MNRYFRIKKTQIQMMQDRGYAISPFEETILRSTVRQFRLEYASIAQESKELEDGIYSYHRVDGKITPLVYTHEKTGHRCLVIYTNKILKETLKSFDQRMYDNSYEYGIIITTEKPVAEAAKIIKQKIPLNFDEYQKYLQDPIGRVPIQIQVFLENELSHRPIGHVFVPTHTVVDVNTREKWKMSNGGRLADFPVIRYHDKIAKYLGFLPRSMIYITRDNVTQGTIMEKEDYIRIVT